MNNKTLATLVVFALAFAVVPASAHGADDTFASKVHAGDWDVSLTTLDGFVIADGDAGDFAAAFDDIDGDGELDFSEPLYLVQGSTGVGPFDCNQFGEGDIRLADGSQVMVGDDEEGEDCELVSNADLTDVSPDGADFYIGFVDETGDDFTQEDVVYANVFDYNTEDHEVDTGDFNMDDRARVTASSDDHGSDIVELGFDILVLDNDGDGDYSVGDYVFLDWDDGSAHPKAADGVIDILDIWLSTDMLGQKVGAGDNIGGQLTGVSELLGWEFAFGDVDGSDDYSAGDSLYLVDGLECGDEEVHKDAVRLSGSNAGSLVTVSDADYKDDLFCFGGEDATTVMIADETGDGFSGSDDGVYLDVGPNLDVEVSVGDADLLTGMRVTASAADLDTPLTAGAFDAFNFVDNDADGEFSNGDGLFLSQTADELEIDDIELVDDHGRYLDGSEFNVQYDFIDAGAWFIAHHDEDEDLVIDPTEAIYLVPGAADFDCGGDEVIEELFIRLTAVGSHAAGTVVEEGDSDDDEDLFLCGAGDVDIGGVAFDPIFAFIDETGDGYSHDDELFVDMNGDLDVTVGDLKLEIGGRATISNSDIGAQLTDFDILGSGFAFLDTDDDDLDFGLNEPFYLVQDIGAIADFGAAIDDVRLAPIGALGGHDDHDDDDDMDDDTGDDDTGDDDNTGDDNTGDDNTGDDNTGDDNTGDDNTGDDNTGDDTSDDESTKTPGFELVALVAALGAALVLVRRRL